MFKGIFFPKPNGGARLVVDLSYLNSFIERPVHPFVAGTDLLKNLDPNSKVFCKLDAVLGYYQIPLDEDSKKLFTFLLASGRYRYLEPPWDVLHLAMSGVNVLMQHFVASLVSIN